MMTSSGMTSASSSWRGASPRIPWMSSCTTTACTTIPREPSSPPKQTNLSTKVANLSKGETILEIISQGLMARAVWNKVVRTSLMRENGILFPEGMRNEDTDWSASVHERAQSVGWFDDPAVRLAALAYRVLGFWGMARLLGIGFRLRQRSRAFATSRRG